MTKAYFYDGIFLCLIGPWCKVIKLGARYSLIKRHKNLRKFCVEMSRFCRKYLPCVAGF